MAVQHFIILFATSAILGFLNWIAIKKGYYRLPPLKLNSIHNISTGDLIGIFLVFIGMEIIFIPIVVLLWQWVTIGGGFGPDLLKISRTAQGWWNLLAVLSGTGAVILYTYLLQSKGRFIFWGPTASKGLNRRIHDVLIGISTWWLSYPIIIIISQVVALAIIFIGPIQHQDQVAIKHLKMTLANPLLFWSNIILVVTLVPISEEILFRGFLQKWLVQGLGRFKGIFLTSICFALFHFSFSQKWDNVDLILSLFALSCYLGFIYERQQTLLAPISLHMTFNAISLSMLIMGEWKND
jgi:uncharacterized protein